MSHFPSRTALNLLALAHYNRPLLHGSLDRNQAVARKLSIRAMIRRGAMTADHKPTPYGLRLLAGAQDSRYEFS